MNPFRYPGEGTMISRKSWAVNRAGVVMMTVAVILAVVAIALHWNAPLALVAVGLSMLGLFTWFLAGSPVR